MKVIALGKRKGGVYASSTAANMACAAVEEGHQVLLIDTNVQQKSLVKWGQRRTREGGPEVLEATAAELPGMLRNLRGTDGYCIIDTAPHGDSATLEALRGADLILVPCGPTQADLETVDDVRALYKASKSKGRMSILITQYASAQRIRADELEQGLVASGYEVCPNRVRRLVAVPDAWGLGLSAVEYEPSGEAAADARAVWTYAKGILT